MAPRRKRLYAGRFLNAHDYSMDLVRTAGLILGLDLVITVDTMIAHLAGTLDTPVWLLLRKNADWRWMTDRSDLPWYPSMRIYRQEREGDWEAPLHAISRELTRRGED